VSAFLDVFGIALFFLLRGFPRGNEAVILAFGVMADFIDRRAKASSTPVDGAELFGTIVLLVDLVYLIKGLPSPSAQLIDRRGTA
jgi:hypothetical protein